DLTRAPRAHLRALLHDEERRARHRARVVGQPGHRADARRLYRRGEQARSRHDHARHAARLGKWRAPTWRSSKFALDNAGTPTHKCVDLPSEMGSKPMRFLTTGQLASS